MEREIVNPWSWQEGRGWAHGNVLTGAEKLVFCAGQVSVDADGNPIHAGDMAGQIAQALDNLEEVLRGAGLGLGDLVRLTYYVTDLQAFEGARSVLRERLNAAGAQPAATLLHISGLAMPELMIEIEATAAA
jgi:enamine deaminase RidA (YjgF/YER057c/UK114 family)